MRIRGKLTILVAGHALIVAGAICIALFRLERTQTEREIFSRIDAIMLGVQRIALESIEAKDDLMLLSYLKYLMKEHPEVELAVMDRQEHSSKIGQARSELYFRTVIAERPMTGENIHIQLGFSKPNLDMQVQRAQGALAAKILQISGPALGLALLGSFWLGRLISNPISALEKATAAIGEGRLNTEVRATGKDEIGRLSLQFNAMASKLRESARFKEDLMSTITHELNNPLTGLKGFIDYLVESNGNVSADERHRSYDTMQSVIQQMEISLRNAIDLFRAGSLPVLRREAVDPWEIISEVVRLFAATAQMGKVSLQAAGPAGRPLLDADRELVRRIVVNLVSNALKYSPEGGSVKVLLSESTDHVRISVSDEGPGIQPEDREMVFTKYFRAQGADGLPQRIPGSGLGLALAKQAVDLHQGRIWVDSEIGQGSTFHVTLPKLRAAEGSNA